MRPDRIALIALAAFASLGVPRLVLGRAALVESFSDDAFYYLEIAKRVGEGSGLTFDGIHRTNGFHPLWLLLLVPVITLVGQGDVALLRTVVMIEVALVALAAALLYGTLRRRMHESAALIAALTLPTLPGVVETFGTGMESALLLVTMVATGSVYLRAMDRVQAAADAPMAANAQSAVLVDLLLVGTLLLCTTLVRLEAVVLAPAYALGLRRSPRRWLAMSAVVAPPVLGLAVHGLWSRLSFELWLPTSALVKAHWAGRLTAWNHVEHALDVPWPGHWLYRLGTGVPSVGRASCWIQAGYLVMLGCVAASAWRWRLALRAHVIASGAWVMLLPLVLIAFDCVALGQIWPWQYGPAHLASAVLVGCAIAALSRRWSSGAPARWVVVAISAAALVRPVRALMTPERPEHGATWLQASAWLDENTPPSARVGLERGAARLRIPATCREPRWAGE